MSKRRRFFLTYLATAVLSSVVVFFGAPLVRGSIPTERFDNMVRACRSDSPLSGVFMALIRSRPEVAPDPGYDRPPGPQPRIPRPRRTQAPDQPGTAAPVVRQPPPAGSQQDPGVEENSSRQPPPLDYTAMWAVVTNDAAAVYDSSGNLAQELAPGTLVEVACVRTNQTETLAICRYDTKPASMGIAVIRARDLMIRKGSLDSANADLLTLVRKQAQLEMEIRTMRAALASDAAKRNPHSEEYNRARQACVEFNRNAKELRNKRDSSQGAARMELMDKLRSMKEEEVQLRKQYDTARLAFEKWNEAHGNSVQDSEPVRVLQKELADVRKQIGRIDSN